MSQNINRFKLFLLRLTVKEAECQMRNDDS
jgi:hypothetical protein